MELKFRCKFNFEEVLYIPDRFITKGVQCFIEGGRAWEIWHSGSFFPNRSHHLDPPLYGIYYKLGNKISPQRLWLQEQLKGRSELKEVRLVEDGNIFLVPIQTTGLIEIEQVLTKKES